MDTPLNIAQYILNKCTVENQMISNLQLQKIMYIIQREFLQTFHEVAINGVFEAWKYGPVIPEIYAMYCGSGASKIVRLYDNRQIDLTETQIDFLDAIVEEKRGENPWNLVAETHREGGAWYQTYKNGAGDGEIIKNELIESVG